MTTNIDLKEKITIQFFDSNNDINKISLAKKVGLTKQFSLLVFNIAKFLKFGTIQNEDIDKEIINILNLSIDEFENGHNTLSITGKVSPDLFNTSLLQDTLRKIFSLLNSKTFENKSLLEFGEKNLYDLSEFLSDLLYNNIPVEIKWKSTIGETYVWIGNSKTITQLFNSLNPKKKLLESEYYIFSEILEIKENSFKLELRDKTIINGKVGKKIAEEYKYFYNEDAYGTIRIRIVYSKLFNRNYTEYELIEID